MWVPLEVDQVETLTRRRVDICCLQETRWKGSSTKLITGKDSVFKAFWIGNNKVVGGVGIFLCDKWIDNVCEEKRVSD